MKFSENSTFKLPGSEFIKNGTTHELLKEDTKLILEIELSSISDYTKPKWELNSKERLEYSLK